MYLNKRKGYNRFVGSGRSSAYKLWIVVQDVALVVSKNEPGAITAVTIVPAGFIMPPEFIKAIQRLFPLHIPVPMHRN